MMKRTRLESHVADLARDKKGIVLSPPDCNQLLPEFFFFPQQNPARKAFIIFFSPPTNTSIFLATFYSVTPDRCAEPPPCYL